MISVNVKQLMESISEANCFNLPEMNEGTEYLYNNVYRRLATGDNVALSSLDFDSFEPDDITSLSDLYSNVFERNEDSAGGLMSTLRAIAPGCMVEQQKRSSFATRPGSNAVSFI